MTSSPEPSAQPEEHCDHEPADVADIAGEVSGALSELAERPVDEHPEVYEDIHRRLGHTLSGIDHV